MLQELVHNGILVPPRPMPKGISLMIRGEPKPLNPEQEEMAIAWAKKIGTEYVARFGLYQKFHGRFQLRRWGWARRCAVQS